MQDPERSQQRVDPGDLGALLFDPLGGQAARDSQRRGVVGQHHVRAAEVSRRTSHDLDAVHAIGPV